MFWVARSNKATLSSSQADACVTQREIPCGLKSKKRLHVKPWDYDKTFS